MIEKMKELVQASKQRAGLLGLLTCLMQEERELTMSQVKTKIANCIGNLIMLEAMVFDEIEYEVVEACKLFFQEEEALDQAKDLLK